MTQIHQGKLIYLRFFIVVILALGIFFRFGNLDKKTYWHDETRTSLRMSGYRQSEVIQQVFEKHEIGIKDLQKYQKINYEKSLVSTIISLAAEDPKHPPLYFVIVRLWAQLFGDSVATIRSLSGFISLLVFPCLYWLCLELFECPLTAWIAIMLMAVSPFHVLYAQEAREYSLWTVMSLLSSAALLRAMRLQTKRDWGIYAVTVVLGIYSHTLFGLVAIAHGTYVIGTTLKKINVKKLQLPKVLINYLLATIFALFAFAPWAIIIIIKLPVLINNTAWLNENISFLNLVERWIFGFSSVFIDTSDSILISKKDGFTKLLTYLSRLPILLLMGYSIYFLCYRASQRAWLFVLALIGVPVVLLMLPDLVFGGQRSGPVRYLIPCYLGIQLSVAYLFSTLLISANASRIKIWLMTITVLVTIEIGSCNTICQADNWWNKSYATSEIASIINQAKHPLLLSYPYKGNFGNIISLSYLLEPKVRFRFMEDPNATQSYGDFSDVFLYNPSELLLRNLEQEKIYNPELLYKPNRLWRIAKYQ